MVGAVVQHGLQADQRIASQRALLNGFLQALFHGGVEVTGHAAAEDFLGEDQIVLLVLRLEAYPDITALTIYGKAGAAVILTQYGQSPRTTCMPTARY